MLGGGGGVEYKIALGSAIWGGFNVKHIKYIINICLYNIKNFEFGSNKCLG